MPFEGQVSAMFNKIIPVDEEILQNSKISLEFEDQNGIFADITYDPNSEDTDINDDIFEKISQNHQMKSFTSNGILNYKVLLVWSRNFCNG